MKLKASYTVEAALIMPIIFFVILYMLHVGEWMLDQFLLQAAAVRTAEYTADLVDEGYSDAALKGKAYADEAGEEFLLGNVRIESKVEVSVLNKVTVSYSAVLSTPFPRIFRDMGLSIYEDIEISENCRALKSPEQIRLLKAKDEWKEALNESDVQEDC